MNIKIYSPKIGWSLYAVFVIFCGIIISILFTTPIEWFAIILLLTLSVFIYTLIVTTKYAIRDNELGVKIFYRWRWYPIDKIASIREITSIISTPTALSPHRIAIKFSDPKVLKSHAPLEISPKEKNEFIAQLLEINPKIQILQ